MVDRIVEGKRRKLVELSHKKRKVCGGNESSVQDESLSEHDETDMNHIDREAVLREELDKIKCIDEKSTLVQIFTGECIIGVKI
jgi:hypothetical protein